MLHEMRLRCKFTAAQRAFEFTVCDRFGWRLLFSDGDVRLLLLRVVGLRCDGLCFVLWIDPTSILVVGRRLRLSVFCVVFSVPRFLRFRRCIRFRLLFRFSRCFFCVLFLFCFAVHFFELQLSQTTQLHLFQMSVKPGRSAFRFVRGRFARQNRCVTVQTAHNRQCAVSAIANYQRHTTSTHQHQELVTDRQHNTT